jgi:hypothetical protein
MNATSPFSESVSLPRLTGLVHWNCTSSLPPGASDGAKALVNELLVLEHSGSSAGTTFFVHDAQY